MEAAESVTATEEENSSESRKGQGWLQEEKEISYKASEDCVMTYFLMRFLIRLCIIFRVFVRDDRASESKGILFCRISDAFHTLMCFKPRSR